MKISSYFVESTKLRRKIKMDKETNYRLLGIYETLELLAKASHINMTLIWMTATMAVIAAINSLIQVYVYKWLVFMIVSLCSLIIYNVRK